MPRTYMHALVVLFSLSVTAASAEGMCTYSTWTWNAERQQAEAFQNVVKPRSDLTPEERHPTLPCSICQEDQTLIDVGGVKPFPVCQYIATDISQALGDAVAAGFPINEIVGYRVGRTKGDLDEDGRRTQYSLHSFGLAIDINPNQNGLYDQCIVLSPSCRLRRGGEWRPNKPGAITPGSPIYDALIAMGWRWGGELAGQQKDMMHFSPSGD